MAPITRKRSAKAKGYQPIDTEGKLFRVRDKDYSDGTPVKVWGENLTYEAARALKEKVVGAKKSRSARVEEMSIALPSADPTVEGVRQKGLAVGRHAAASAQQRANQLAARRRQEASASSAPKPKRGLHVAPKPVPMKLDDVDLEAPEVLEEVELDENDEVGAVEAAADDDINEYEAKGKELYEAYQTLGGLSKPTPWGELAPKEQAAFSFEATAEQGPHIDALRAAAVSQEIPAPAGNGVAGDQTTS